MRGVPVFNGTRVPISMVLASLKAGFDLSQLQDAYPFLTQQLLDVALTYDLVGIATSAAVTSKRSDRRLVSSERILLRRK